MAGGEGFRAVGRGDFHPQGGFPNFYAAETVDQADGGYGPAGFKLIEEELELALSHGLKALVFECADRTAGFGVTDESHEGDDGAAGGVEGAVGGKGKFVNGLEAEVELALHGGRVQPPWTGGKRETSSPSLSR